MVIYTATFARHDGTEFAQIGSFSEITLALAAAADYALWREEQAAAGIGAVTPPALTWRHHKPDLHRERFHELWVGRDGWMNYFMVQRVELGARPWRQESVVAGLQNGSLVPPSWAMPLATESADGAGTKETAAAP